MPLLDHVLGAAVSGAKGFGVKNVDDFKNIIHEGIDATTDNMAHQVDLAIDGSHAALNNPNLTTSEQMLTSAWKQFDHGFVGVGSEAILGGGRTLLGGLFAGTAFALKHTAKAIGKTAMVAGMGLGYGLGVVGKYGGLAAGAALYHTGAVIGKGLAKGIGVTAPIVGKGTVQAGKIVGEDALALGKGAWAARNSPTFHVATAAVGTAVVIPAMADSQVKQVQKTARMGMVNVSTNAGNTFIGPTGGVAGAGVDDYGASGDLVFALHNLRHGG